MPVLDVDGVAINHIDEGGGPPVVLVHGFASSLDGNWRRPGIIDALRGAGRRVIALDCRGHGQSAKPHIPDAYEHPKMADDVIALMDHLGIDQADLAGYSMGGFLSASLLARHPGRFRSVILAGIGDAVLTGEFPRERSEAIARAMESPDGGRSESDIARGFRAFAEATGNDLQALGAMQRARGGRRGFDGSALRRTDRPVLVIVGDKDTLVGSADGVAAAIPGARLVKVPGDHLSAVGAPQLKQAMLEFLAEHSPVAAAR